MVRGLAGSLGIREPGNSMTADVNAWAVSILKIAYERDLSVEQQAELVGHIENYLGEARGLSIETETAKNALMNEVIDIAPVIEPFPRVLKRVLKAQKTS